MTYSQFVYGLLTAAITAPLAAWLTKICRADILHHAYRLARVNAGAPRDLRFDGRGAATGRLAKPLGGQHGAAAALA